MDSWAEARQNAAIEERDNEIRRLRAVLASAEAFLSAQIAFMYQKYDSLIPAEGLSEEALRNEIRAVLGTEVFERPPLPTEIRQAINRASRENRSNTPDHILAHFLMASLAAFEDATNRRSEWYGVDDRPGRGR